MRGRRPIAIFGADTRHINEIATTAANAGAYTVESNASGICYLMQGDIVVIASSGGFVKLHLSTAEIIADELYDILQQYKADKREGRMPMSTREIQKMLEL